jgi:ATP-dependent DNA helicase DinG
MPVGGAFSNAIEDVLGEHGALAQRLEAYSHRPQQQAMAEVVGDVLAQGQTLICEAGTGTGKTFAYLVPALLSGLRVVVSTGTRNLQDQLYHRDLPTIRGVLGLPVRIALLKGRANYLCLHRLDRAMADPRRRHGAGIGQLRAVRDWSVVTRLGDIAELSIPEQDPVWPMVTSTAENCLGQGCPQWSRCHFMAARREAQEAELVVINHHLLCADIALRDEGQGEVLPGADAFIVDEAHQLPDVAGSFFGVSVSGRQLLDLARDVENEYQREAGDLPVVLDAALALNESAHGLRRSLGEGDRRDAWRELESDPRVQEALRATVDALDALVDRLEPVVGCGKGLEQCQARARGLSSRLLGLMGQSEADQVEQVRWFDVQGRGFRLQQTPLDVAEIFRAHRRQRRSAWVFTSATLAVGDSFEHFSRQLGIDDARTERWESPFDYQHQALWFVPRGFPDPAEPRYVNVVVDLACDVLEMSHGRAFLLFTSHRALSAAARLLESRIAYPLLVQGSAPRAALIERFRQLGNAVLLGTSSFWEGVDVRGDALSCVIIDKLPFAAPSDPILQARVDALKRRGANPFRDLQLPQAVIALKQGAGRLIRDAADRGVLVVCDPRLLRRSYGHAFLNSLPPMARSRELEDVCAFFAQTPQRRDNAA